MDRFAYLCKYLHICKYTHICKSVHVNGFAHICKICTICKFLKFAPGWDQVQISICILHICKSVHVNGNQNEFIVYHFCPINVEMMLLQYGFSSRLLRIFHFWHLLHNNWHFQLSKVFCTIFEVAQVVHKKNVCCTATYLLLILLNPIIKSEMRSFKRSENIHKKEGGSYYVVSANKASSVTL